MCRRKYYSGGAKKPLAKTNNTKPCKKKQVTRNKKLPKVRYEITVPDLPETMNSFKRLMNAFARDEIDRGKFTALCYSFNIFAGFMRLQMEFKMQERLDILDKKLEEFLNGQKNKCDRG